MQNRGKARWNDQRMWRVKNKQILCSHFYKSSHKISSINKSNKNYAEEKNGW